MKKDFKVVCRGGGDIASGIVHRLVRAGYSTIILETERPAAVRRQVSFCEAVYDGFAIIEGVTAVHIPDASWIDRTLERGEVPVLVDPDGESLSEIKPDVLVDAIIAKRSKGLGIDAAKVVVAIGPGFTAGKDCDYVIESKRGHNLGRIISNGEAQYNTGIPGNICGYSIERVIRLQEEGYLKIIHGIGSVVVQGEEIARLYEDEACEGEYYSVRATMSGLVRGMLREGFYVTKGMKLGDIDPREDEYNNCFSISDKARCIGGSVLEIVCACANGCKLD